MAAAAVAVGKAIVGGSYYENCAFNPSISPIKSALVAAMCARHAEEEQEQESEQAKQAAQAMPAVIRALLVEVEGCSISHEADVRAICAALSPAAQVRVVRARYFQA